MAEKKTKNDKEDEQQDGQESNFQEEKAIESGQGQTDLDDKLDSFKAEAVALQLIPKATFYKYDHPERGSTYQQLGYFAGDDIPSTDDIGRKHGSGRYFVILKRPKGNKPRPAETYTFKLHPVYDEIKKKAELEEIEKGAKKALDSFPTAAGAPSAGGQAGSIRETFYIVHDLLALLLPAVIKQNEPAPQPQRQDSEKDILGTHEILRKILKSNLFDTADLYKQLQRKLTLQAPAEETEDEEEGEAEPMEQESNLLEKIVKMIEPFFNLIAKRGALGQAAAATLKAAPQFAEILKDPQLCKMIISYFDRTKGRASADIALQNIGINRARFFQPAQRIAAPTSSRTQP